MQKYWRKKKDKVGKFLFSNASQQHSDLQELEIVEIVTYNQLWNEPIPEMLTHIFSFLSTKDVVKCARVCKSWKTISRTCVQVQPPPKRKVESNIRLSDRIRKLIPRPNFNTTMYLLALVSVAITGYFTSLTVREFHRVAKWHETTCMVENSTIAIQKCISDCTGTYIYTPIWTVSFYVMSENLELEGNIWSVYNFTDHYSAKIQASYAEVGKSYTCFYYFENIEKWNVSWSINRMPKSFYGTVVAYFFTLTICCYAGRAGKRRR